MDTKANHGTHGCGGRKPYREVQATVRILKTRGRRMVMQVSADETGSVLFERLIDPDENGVLQDLEVALGVELGAKWAD